MADDPVLTTDDERVIAEDASSLYDEAPCGYLYTRPDGTLLRVNRVFLEWTGYQRAELLGRRFQDLLNVGGRIFHETHFGPLLHMQGAVREIALDIVTRQGSLLPVLVNAVQKRDASGRPVLTRMSVFNATDRKKYERELQLARKRAEESARSKSELLSTISHDMRSPLGAILGAAQLLGRSQLTTSQQTYVRVLRSSSETLLNLVNDVLDLSKIESGRVTLERRPFDLRQLVLDLLSTLNVRAEQKQIALRVAIADAVPAMLVGDPVKLGQILTNLVANAVKFTERGSVAVSVAVRREADGRVELDFKVSDTGIGIPADRLQHIFEDFTQASYDIAASYGGVGLGLAIVRRLLALHGSKITVESVVDQGSIFSFTIGFDVALDAAAAAGIGADAAVRDASRVSGMRVLLVEDNTFDAFMVGRALTSWQVGHEVCPTVTHAIEKLRSTPVDLVLVSAKLTDGDPAGAGRAIASAVAGSRMPLVLLAPASAAVEAAARADVYVDVLPKPVDPSVLFATLASVRP